jgi:post-segregation antitoxin (ccd killing protein)
MTEAKRKISVTVDSDLVAEIESAGENLSARVNDALRNELATRRRQRALAEFLDHLEKTEGPLDTAEDEAEIERFMRLLGGAPA